jgi:hypothetical protein
MDITLEIINHPKVSSVTFYDITAIGNGTNPQTCIIYSNGMEFECNMPKEQLWAKIKAIRNESAARK